MFKRAHFTLGSAMYSDLGLPDLNYYHYNLFFSRQSSETLLLFHFFFNHKVTT